MLKNFIQKDLVSWLKVNVVLAIAYLIFSIARDVITGEMHNDLIAYYVGYGVHILVIYLLIPRFIYKSIMKMMKKKAANNEAI